MKFKREPYTSFANDTFLVRHKGRAIKIYRMPIPGFYGEISEEVKQLAAEKAYSRGWRKIVLKAADKLESSTFDGGYCWLLALNVSMAQRDDSDYRTDHYLCDMDAYGEMYKPAPRNRQEDEENSIWARVLANDGWDPEMAA
jgi:hypothetical protein